MSRVGKKPISVPKGVEVKIEKGTLTAKGPKGTLFQTLIEGIDVKIEEGSIVLSRDNDSASARSRHGLLRALLANAVTALCHGVEAAAAAEATAREVFEKGGVGDDLPTLELSSDELTEGISVVQLFVRSGLAKSGKDAKRLIAEGGARLNGDPVIDAGLMIGAGELADPVKLTAGRKRHALVVLG